MSELMCPRDGLRCICPDPCTQRAWCAEAARLKAQDHADSSATHQSGAVASATRKGADTIACSPVSDSPGVTCATSPDPDVCPLCGGINGHPGWACTGALAPDPTREPEPLCPICGTHHRKPHPGSNLDWLCPRNDMTTPTLTDADIDAVLRGLIDAGNKLYERIEHIGCHNCGTTGRPDPCDNCAIACAAWRLALNQLDAAPSVPKPSVMLRRGRASR